jgi:hypothetical protein
MIIHLVRQGYYPINPPPTAAAPAGATAVPYPPGVMPEPRSSPAVKGKTSHSSQLTVNTVARY